MVDDVSKCDKADNHSEKIYTIRHQQGTSSPLSENDMQIPTNNIVFKPYKVENTTR